MADMHVGLLKLLVGELGKEEVRLLNFQFLPIHRLPSGSHAKLVADLFAWLYDDVGTRLPMLCDGAVAFLQQRRLCTFLRTCCHIKLLPGVKKAALAARLRDELLKDALHADTSKASNVAAAAGDAHGTNVADAAGDAHGTNIGDAAGDTRGTDAPVQMVAVEPASTHKCLRKRLGHLWRKGAKRLWQRTVSVRIKDALKTYTLNASGACKLLQVRKEIASKVGMSLESGQARLFFHRQLMKHLMSMKRKRRKRHPPDSVLVYERRCMSFEDAMSGSLG